MTYSLYRYFVCTIFALSLMPFIASTMAADNVTAGSTAATTRSAIESRLVALEKKSNGRLGIRLLDGKTGHVLASYRADERFPMTSTFKLVLSAAALHRNMQQAGFLQQKVNYQKSMLVAHSPITEPHQTTGLSVLKLCAAAIQYSDNTAANLLIKRLGGVEKVNQFARSIGDIHFTLSRIEPLLNSAIPGDNRDTTTPAAMAGTLQRLLFGGVLDKEHRDQLSEWLKGNTTGGASIRAGAPAEWTIGDKTGSGAYGTTNDVAVLWPDKGEPLILAVYFTQHNAKASSRHDVVSEAARIVLSP